MSQELVNGIKQAFDYLLSDIHTVLPGEVSKYDKSGPTIEAKPMIKKLFKNGDEIELPVIVSVPVVFPRTSKFHFSFPLEKGDAVLLLFSERSLENWLSRGVVSIPGDTRKFDLSDAIAIPGLWAKGKGALINSASEMEIVFNDVEITSDGYDFKIMNGNASFESNGGQIKINNDGLTVD